MSSTGSASTAETARRHLVEAEEEYRRASKHDYVTRLVRDSAIVDAHCAGLSSREISQLVGDIGQPNVIRARRRMTTHKEAVPSGSLSTVDALRESGLSPREFILAVHEGQVQAMKLARGVRAFRAEDVRRLRSTS